MSQTISNAYRIAAAEAAIADHCVSMRRNHDDEKPCCTEDDATDLLQSLALWAETNGICLRLQRPVFVGMEGGNHE